MKKFLYLIIVLLAVQSCRDDDCPVEPDPCSEYPEEIEIITSLRNRSYCPIDESNEHGEYSQYLLDTFIDPSRILFELNYEYDSVHWQLGNDPRIFRTNQLLFDFFEYSGDVIIKAIAYRNKNSKCFGADDDGIDSIFRTINIQSLYNAPIFGTYRGIEVGTTDSFNFTIGIDTFISDFDPNEEYYETYYQGLPKGSNLKHKFGMTWESIFDQNSPANRSLDGLALCYTNACLDTENYNSIIVHWRMKDIEEVPRIFKGTRIN